MTGFTWLDLVMAVVLIGVVGLFVSIGIGLRRVDRLLTQLHEERMKNMDRRARGG